MNRTAQAFADLEYLVRLLDTSAEIDRQAEWTAVLETLAGLEDEGERFALPIARVREQSRRYRHSIGAVLGLEADEGHSRTQHLSWALGAVWRLRLDRDPMLPAGSRATTR